jgi:hypothetical protein
VGHPSTAGLPSAGGLHPAARRGHRGAGDPPGDAGGDQGRQGSRLLARADARRGACGRRSAGGRPGQGKGERVPRPSFPAEGPPGRPDAGRTLPATSHYRAEHLRGRRGRRSCPGPRSGRSPLARAQPCSRDVRPLPAGFAAVPAARRHSASGAVYGHGQARQPPPGAVRQPAVR